MASLEKGKITRGKGWICVQSKMECVLEGLAVLPGLRTTTNFVQKQVVRKDRAFGYHHRADGGRQKGRKGHLQGLGRSTGGQLGMPRRVSLVTVSHVSTQGSVLSFRVPTGDDPNAT